MFNRYSSLPPEIPIVSFTNKKTYNELLATDELLNSDIKEIGQSEKLTSIKQTRRESFAGF